eukprot:TRINITY_DN1592_c0_g1_i1.p1 TRINITY_DN1592_c0_g1~~TRINITY_DN1592_c0_g1_i1.p1  ORF type:complete len:123 (-),score=12.85 TRINITY_DN1592_c0_g1_i1:52-420(-)
MGSKRTVTWTVFSKDSLGVYWARNYHEEDELFYSVTARSLDTLNSRCVKESKNLYEVDDVRMEWVFEQLKIDPDIQEYFETIAAKRKTGRKEKKASRRRNGKQHSHIRTSGTGYEIKFTNAC